MTGFGNAQELFVFGQGLVKFHFLTCDVLDGFYLLVPDSLFIVSLCTVITAKLGDGCPGDELFAAVLANFRDFHIAAHSEKKLGVNVSGCICMYPDVSVCNIISPFCIFLVAGQQIYYLGQQLSNKYKQKRVDGQQKRKEVINKK
jgi:hypothetical protein